MWSSQMSSGAQLSEADGIRRRVLSELTIVPHVRKLAEKSFVKSPKKYRGKKLDASGIVIVGKVRTMLIIQEMTGAPRVSG